MHDSKVRYVVKKVEQETTWECSYGSNKLISVV